MFKIVVFRAHLPEHVEHIKRFIERGRRVIMHTKQVTPEVAELSKHPLVQSRFGGPENLTHMADLVIT